MCTGAPRHFTAKKGIKLRAELHASLAHSTSILAGFPNQPDCALSLGFTLTKTRFAPDSLFEL